MRLKGWLLVLLGFACGPEPRGPIEVPAAPELSEVEAVVEMFPPEGLFTDAMEVTLLSEEGAQIFYSLDGSDPLPSSSWVYQEPLVITETTLVRALAVDADGMWSTPASGLFRQLSPVDPVEIPERALSVDRPQLVFTPAVAQEQGVKSVRITSRGTEPVYLAHVEIGSDGRGYFEEGIFSVSDPAPMVLMPGQSLELRISYRATRTLRAAELRVHTDVQHPSDGIVRVQLLGRLLP